MRRTTITLAAMCAALALTAGIAAAQGTLSDRTTYVTFSGPVSLPGVTLPAGTYTFRLADSATDRHIVQVFNREGTKLFTTLLAVPAQRSEASGDPVITFKETPSDRPPAVHYWYYAGEKDGNELVYPKAQAMRIAQASGEPVMAVDSSGTSIDDWKSGGISRVTSAEAQPTTPEQPPAPATAAPSRPTVPPPSATDTGRPAGTSGSLPKTASELPLVGLIGLFALGGAVAIRIARAI